MFRIFTNIPSRAVGRAERWKKGDRMLVGKRYFCQPPFRKKEEHAGRYSIRALSTFRMDPQSQICVGRSIRGQKTGGEIEYPHGNLPENILRRIWTRVSRLENGGVAAASARGLSPDVLGVHIVAVVGGGCPRVLLQ